jgi:uncharacterized protein (TIGR02246 family)
MKAPVLVASAFLLAAAPTFAQQVPAETAATNHRFEQAFNRGDAAAVAALYTENATLLPPGADLMTGRQAAQSFWQATYGSGARNLSLNTVSVESYGDAAREIGRFSVNVPVQGGQTTRVEGKYVVIWKKTADGWRLTPTSGT